MYESKYVKVEKFMTFLCQVRTEPGIGFPVWYADARAIAHLG